MAEIKGITPVCPHCGWAGSRHSFTGNNEGVWLGVNCPWCKSEYQALSALAQEEAPAEGYTLELTDKEDAGIKTELAAAIKELEYRNWVSFAGFQVYWLKKLLHAMENPSD